MIEKATPEQIARRQAVDREAHRLARLASEDRAAASNFNNISAEERLLRLKPDAFESSNPIKCPFDSGSVGFTVERDGRQARAHFDAEAARDCEECCGTCYRSQLDESNYSRSIPCRGGRMAKLGRLFDLAEIPASLSAASFAESDKGDEFTSQLYEGELEWASTMQPGDRGRWFSGNVGTGKTHLACAIVRHLTLERGIRCQFLRFATLLQRLKRSFNARPNDELGDILAPISSIPVLVIDDLGASRSLFEIDTFELLVSDRIERTGCTLIVCSNYTPRQLAEKTAGNSKQNASDALEPMARAASRLQELVSVVPIYGEDRRKGR